MSQFKSLNEFSGYIIEWAKDEPYFVDLTENNNAYEIEFDNIDSDSNGQGSVILWGTFAISFKSGAIQAKNQKEILMLKEIEDAAKAIRKKYE